MRKQLTDIVAVTDDFKAMCLYSAALSGDACKYDAVEASAWTVR